MKLQILLDKLNIAEKLNKVLKGNQELPKCPSNHTLVFNRTRNYNCDICKNNYFNGGYQCDHQCNYDECPSCYEKLCKQNSNVEVIQQENDQMKLELKNVKERLFQAEQMCNQKKGNQELPKCPSNHELVYNTSRRYNCDRCRSSFKKGGFQCLQRCNYDECPNCW